jgi:hypothetical protein
MIHYYTEFLGMKDIITEDDLYVDIKKTELEKEISELKIENQNIWYWLKKLTSINKTLLSAAGSKKIQSEFKKQLNVLLSEGSIDDHLAMTPVRSDRYL